MEESIKKLWLSRMKAGKVAVIESYNAPINTNCVWLKDGKMSIYGNSGWEELSDGGGSGGEGTEIFTLSTVRVSSGIEYSAAEFAELCNVTEQNLTDLSQKKVYAMNWEQYEGYDPEFCVLRYAESEDFLQVSAYSYNDSLDTYRKKADYFVYIPSTGKWSYQQGMA